MVSGRTELRDGTDYGGLDCSKKDSWRRSLKGGSPPVVSEFVLNIFHILSRLAAQLTYELNFFGIIGQ